MRRVEEWKGSWRMHQISGGFPWCNHPQAVIILTDPTLGCVSEHSQYFSSASPYLADVPISATLQGLIIFHLSMQTCICHLLVQKHKWCKSFSIWQYHLIISHLFLFSLNLASSAKLEIMFYIIIRAQRTSEKLPSEYTSLSFLFC